jgi:hypothetical protein
VYVVNTPNHEQQHLHLPLYLLHFLHQPHAVQLLDVDAAVVAV